MSGRRRVVVTDFIGEPLAQEVAVLGDLADVVVAGAEHEDDLQGQVEQAEALMVYHLIKLTAATMDRLQRCKLIVRCGVGYDNVDIVAARRRGIDVANVPDYGTEEVADSALGLLLALTRGFHLLDQRLRDRRGGWTYTEARPIRRLRGRVLGIVGLGRIGTAMALRGQALGMQVTFYDPYVPDGVEKAIGVRRARTLAELLTQSNVLSLHCPLTDETHHLVNDDSLAQLPAGSYLVNTARGGVADTDAVLRSLESGHLAGAAIDVLEQEPPRDDDPLLVAWRDPQHPAHDRLILNPHAAFYCEEGLEEMRRKGSENCRRVLLGEPPRNVVN